MESKTISTIFDSSFLDRASRPFGSIEVVTKSDIEVTQKPRFGLRARDVVITSYYTIDSIKQPSSPADDYIWSGWNQIMLMLIQRNTKFFAQQMHSISAVKCIFEEIPENYTLLSRLKNLEAELGISRYANSLNVKSLFSLLRFLPILEEKSTDLSLDVDDETGRFCVSFAAQVGEGAKKTLDLVFTDDGEILFTYIEGGQGYSRISGSSYLTDYLVNSNKFRKLMNIFDY